MQQTDLINERILKSNSSSDLLEVLSQITPSIYQFTLVAYKCEQLIDCDGTELLSVQWNKEQFQDDLFSEFLIMLISKTTNPTQLYSMLQQSYSKFNEPFPNKFFKPLLVRAISLKHIEFAYYINQQIILANLNDDDTDLITCAIKNNAKETIIFLSQFALTEQLDMTTELLLIIHNLLSDNEFLKQCNELMAMALHKNQFFITMQVFATIELLHINANFRTFELQMIVYKIMRNRLVDNFNTSAKLHALDDVLRGTSDQMIKYSHSTNCEFIQMKTLAHFDIFESTDLYRNYKQLKNRILRVINQWNHALYLLQHESIQIIDYFRGFDIIVMPYLVEHLFYYRNDVLPIDLIVNTDSLQHANTIIHVLKSWDPPVSAYLRSGRDYESNVVYVPAEQIRKLKREIL